MSEIWNFFVNSLFFYIFLGCGIYVFLKTTNRYFTFVKTFKINYLARACTNVRMGFADEFLACTAAQLLSFQGQNWKLLLLTDPTAVSGDSGVRDHL